ncbi:MAG: hypothetical protein F6K32_10750 [Desertifilum sp. SIO1I2]|nr:hypothetical protein [Desertifilum sp. SIO1I2]
MTRQELEDQLLALSLSDRAYMVQYLFGIIVCTNDPDRQRMAVQIDTAIAPLDSLTSQLIRVVRPSS